MDRDSLCSEELDRQVLVGTRRGDSQHNAPTAFYGQPNTRLLLRQLTVEFRQVPPDAQDHLFVESMALLEKLGNRQLHGRIHGEVGVGNYLEACEGFAFPLLRPAGDQPGGLHLWQPGNLGETAQRKRRRAAIRREARWPVFLERKVEKHFIRDNGHLPCETNGIQLREICALYEVDRKIIGVHDDHAARARRDGLLQCMKIDLPSVVVKQLIAHQVDVLYVRQKIEQRIAW